MRLLAEKLGQMIPPVSYLAIDLSFLAAMNLFIAILGFFTNNFTLEESMLYLAIALLTLSLALVTVSISLRFNPKEPEPVGNKVVRIVTIGTIIMVLGAVAISVIAVIYTLPVMEQGFGFQAGHIIFFRFITLASFIGFIIGFVGASLNWFFLKSRWKL